MRAGCVCVWWCAHTTHLYGIHLCATVHVHTCLRVCATWYWSTSFLIFYNYTNSVETPTLAVFVLFFYKKGHTWFYLDLFFEVGNLEIFYKKICSVHAPCFPPPVQHRPQATSCFFTTTTASKKVFMPRPLLHLPRRLPRQKSTPIHSTIVPRPERPSHHCPHW